MAVGAAPTIVYAGAAAAAASLTVTRPTQGALLPGISRTPEELTAANGLSGTVEATCLMLGPLAAAGILAFATPTAVFVAGTLACLVAALLVTRLPGATVAHSEVGSHGPDEHGGLLAGIRTVARAGDTRLLVGILALRMVTSGAMDVLFVLLALETSHIGESGASMLNAALGFGTIAGGAVTSSLVGRQRLAPVLAAGALVGAGRSPSSGRSRRSGSWHRSSLSGASGMRSATSSAERSSSASRGIGCSRAGSARSRGSA